MTTEEKRSEVVRYWLEKTEESMASARREFEAGSLAFAMNRLFLEHIRPLILSFIEKRDKCWYKADYF